MRQALWGDVDPYSPVPKVEPNIQGWRRDHPLLNEAAEQSSRIVEIGVWKGASCIDMAKVNPHADILAVDTWRGSAEHWLRAQWKPIVRSAQLYDVFRMNMMEAFVKDQVTPLPLDSQNAAIVCKSMGLTFDLAHIDGGHDYMSAYLDLTNWSPLIEKGGAIVMDDVEAGFPDVDRALERFCEPFGWRVTETRNGKARVERVS